MEKRLCIFLSIIASVTGLTFLSQYVTMTFFAPDGVVIPPHMIDKANQSLVIGVIMIGLAIFFSFVGLKRR